MILSFSEENPIAPSEGTEVSVFDPTGALFGVSSAGPTPQGLEDEGIYRIDFKNKTHPVAIIGKTDRVISSYHTENRIFWDDAHGVGYAFGSDVFKESGRKVFRFDPNAKGPEKLVELGLEKIVQNQDATKIINKMHGKDLDKSDNFIAHYGGGGSKNILYLSVYENAEQAKTNLMGMAMKMANNSSVFSPLTYDEMAKTVHFQTEGMGFKHYFYRTDNILIWWQVEPDKAVATFEDLLAYDFAALKNRAKGKN